MALLVEWEQANPLRLERADVEKRVIFAYRQWQQQCWLTPLVWFGFCAYLAAQGLGAAQEYEKVCACGICTVARWSVLPACCERGEQGMQAVPTSVLLGFAYADYEEARKNFSKASAIYERMLEIKDITDATLVCPI